MEPRAEWLADVETASRLNRTARAFRHDSIARGALLDCRCAELRPGERYSEHDTPSDPSTLAHGYSRCSHKRRAKWHADRSKGQLRRFERVARCGVDELTMFCGQCNRVHGKQAATCDDFRACVKCRGRRASRLRKRFSVARKNALRRFGAYRAWRAREVFVTLTYPDSGDPAADASAIVGAWPTFIASVRAFLEARHGMPKTLTRTSPWLRVLEATPGTDARGHAHLHFWAFTPFLPHELVRLWWARALPADARARLPQRKLSDVLEQADRRDRTALEAAARGAELVPWPVLDIQACHGDPGRELVKYLVKDQHEGKRVDGDTFAALYDALEGRRTVVASLHFWSELPPLPCVRCGAIGATRIESARDKLLAHELEARGPPS